MATLYQVINEALGGEGLTAKEHRKQSKEKASFQRKNPTSREKILPALEMITGASASGEYGKKGSLIEAAMATPFIGHLGKGFKASKYIGRLFRGQDSKSFAKKIFSQPQVSGVGREYAKNQELVHKLKNIEWEDVGKTRSGFSPGSERFTISIPKKPVMSVGGRDVSAVMYGSKRGNIIQPFYKSSGFGAPSAKTKGEWLPFEGWQTKGGIGKLKIDDESVFMGEGWFVKGYKKPGSYGEIFGSSTPGGKIKRGLPIHEETGKKLEDYYR